MQQPNTLSLPRIKRSRCPVHWNHKTSKNKACTKYQIMKKKQLELWFEALFFLFIFMFFYKEC